MEKKGVAVERQFELGGNLAHDALLSDQIDVYPEYTGTAFTAILKHKPMTDADEVYNQTKSEYAEKFNLSVSPSLGFSNDFAILVRGDVGAKIESENDFRRRSRFKKLASRIRSGFYVARRRLRRFFKSLQF